MLKRCVAPHRTSYASEALDCAGGSLKTPLLVASCHHAHQTAHRRVPEADAEGQWYEADCERRHGVDGGGGGESDRRASEADSERRPVAEMPDDWPNHPALNHRAKQAEAGKKIAGPRRVEAEPPREDIPGSTSARLPARAQPEDTRRPCRGNGSKRQSRCRENGAVRRCAAAKSGDLGIRATGVPGSRGARVYGTGWLSAP